MTLSTSSCAFALSAAEPGIYQPQRAASATSRAQGWEGGKIPMPQGQELPSQNYSCNSASDECL